MSRGRARPPAPVRAFGRSIALALLFALVACGSPAAPPDPAPETAPTEPEEPSPEEPVPDEPAPEEPRDELLPVELSDVRAALALGSRVTLAWVADGADAIDVGCIAGDGVRSLASLPAASSGTTIPIPASDCLVIRLTAVGPTDATSVDVPLEHVVTHGGNDGAGSLRAVLAAAPAGATIGFADDVDEVVLATVDGSAAHDAHLVFATDVTVSGRPAAPVVLRSDPSLPDDASGAPVLRSRIGYVPADATVHLDALTLRGGGFVTVGGGLRNDGALTLTRSIVTDNRAWYRGGGIVNFGSAHVQDSELRANVALVTDAEREAPYLCAGDPDRGCVAGDAAYLPPLGEGGAGGGFYNLAGSAVLERTTVADNRAVFSGGGIYVFDGFVEVIDGDVRDNLASDTGTTIDSTSYGGGIAISGTGSAAVRGGSVADNVSADMGGGIGNGTGNAPDRPTTLDGVLVTGNRADGYGGGAINYHTGDPGNLVVIAGTDLSGNTAGVAGDGRFDSLVAGP